MLIIDTRIVIAAEAAEQKPEQEQASDSKESLDQTQVMDDGSDMPDRLDIPSDARMINAPIAIVAATVLIGIIMCFILIGFNRRLERSYHSYVDNDNEA